MLLNLRSTMKARSGVVQVGVLLIVEPFIVRCAKIIECGGTPIVGIVLEEGRVFLAHGGFYLASHPDVAPLGIFSMNASTAWICPP